MKNYTYIFLIGLFVASSSLLSVDFYQKNASAMRAQAEDLFVRTLTGELHRKVVRASLFHYSKVNSDTIPLIIRITTEDGVKIYKVDAKKSRKNISQNRQERSLHTIVCEESPLLPDSLNKLWADALRARKNDARTAVRVSVVTLQDVATVSTSGGGSSCDASSPRFVSYVGSRCEVEVTGCLAYSWWTVCLYHWSPFLWIWVAVVSMLLLLYLFYRFTHRPAEIKVVKEEVIREVIKEVPVPVYVKELASVNLKVYQLQPGLLFDARKQVLVWNGIEKGLTPQSCKILAIFLDAPDYTLTDDEILSKVWGKQVATMKNFTSSCARLCNSLNKVGFSIFFKRVGHNQYRMIVD